MSSSRSKVGATDVSGTGASSCRDGCAERHPERAERVVVAAPRRLAPVEDRRRHGNVPSPISSRRPGSTRWNEQAADEQGAVLGSHLEGRCVADPWPTQRCTAASAARPRRRRRAGTARPSPARRRRRRRARARRRSRGRSSGAVEAVVGRAIRVGPLATGPCTARCGRRHPPSAAPRPTSVVVGAVAVQHVGLVPVEVLQVGRAVREERREPRAAGGGRTTQKTSHWSRSSTTAAVTSRPTADAARRASWRHRRTTVARRQPVRGEEPREGELVACGSSTRGAVRVLLHVRPHEAGEVLELGGLGRRRRRDQGSGNHARCTGRRAARRSSIRTATPSHRRRMT